MILDAVAVALVAYLVVVVPLRGRRSYQRLVANLRRDPTARLAFYRRSLSWKWSLAAVAAAVWL
jgi:hypothetical protein